MVEDVQIDDLAAPKLADQEEQKNDATAAQPEESEDTVAAGEAERNEDHVQVESKK